MTDVAIYSAVRTPVGRAGGALADVRPDDLAAIAVKAAVERAGVDPAALDDVILGCANSAGEDNRNVARMASLLAGLPVAVPGQTINRLCGSGLQAVITAFHAARAGEGSLFVAGGVESMTRAPYVQLKKSSPWDRKPPEIADTTVGWRFVNPRMRQEWTISLGETAEKVARQYGITREEQDAFAYESQRRALRAIRDGVFRDEIVPVTGREHVRTGEREVVDTDEHPRPDVTPVSLASLKPAFAKGGTVTAGSSSGINDGAAALVLGTSHVLPSSRPPVPMARIVSSAVAGVDPSVMGLGPVPATRKALERAGLKIQDIDLIELNEAFAAQAIACMRDLDLDPAKTNIHGGGIALGHPLGATGAKLLTTMVHVLHRTGGRYGLVTMCIGVGQGIALIVERG
jgi:3-oxoadipyl-CoA thiolase